LYDLQAKTDGQPCFKKKKKLMDNLRPAPYALWDLIDFSNASTRADGQVALRFLKLSVATTASITLGLVI
jgi:hypothetical protein